MINYGVLDIANTVTPSIPSTGKMNLYFDSSGCCIMQDSAGSTLNLTTFMNTGWIPVSDTWSYLNGSAITVPTGAANKYAVGDKIKITQTTAKYLYVVDVADTILQVYAGTDYTVANAAITSPNYSPADTPVGFPNSFSYTPTWTATGGSVGGGNTTLDGGFSIEDRLCTVSMNLVTGNTTWFGTTTAWQFSLPVKANTSGRNASGTGWMLDSSASLYYYPKIKVSANATTFTNIYCGDDGSNNSNPAYNVPFTWSNADYLYFSISYFI